MSFPLFTRSESVAAYPVAGIEIPDGLQHTTAIDIHGDPIPSSGDNGLVIALTNGLFGDRKVQAPLAASLMQAAAEHGIGARVIAYDDPLSYGQDAKSQTADNVIRHVANRFDSPVTVIGLSRANITHAAIMDPLLQDGTVGRVHCNVPAGIISPVEGVSDSMLSWQILTLVRKSLKGALRTEGLSEFESADATFVAGRLALNSTRHVIRGGLLAAAEIAEVVNGDVSDVMAKLAAVHGSDRVSLGIGLHDELFSHRDMTLRLQMAGYEGRVTDLATTHMGPLVMRAVAAANFEWASAE